MPAAGQGSINYTYSSSDDTMDRILVTCTDCINRYQEISKGIPKLACPSFKGGGGGGGGMEVLWKFNILTDSRLPNLLPLSGGFFFFK